MISGERKKFAIKPRRTVRVKHPLLSNTVAYVEDGRQGHCYISFDESLVEFVGTKLPRGIAPFDPAYIFVVHIPERKVWRVHANYINGEGGMPLWETHTRPTWLKEAPSGGSNDTTPSTEGSAAGGGDPSSSRGVDDIPSGG